MSYLTHVVTLGDDVLPHGFGLSDLEVYWFENTPYLFTGAVADGGIMRLSLREGTQAQLEQEVWATINTGTLGLTDLERVTLGDQDFLLGAGRHSEFPVLRVLRPDGSIGGLRNIDADDAELRGWSHSTQFRAGDTDMLAVARHGDAGLQIFEMNGDFEFGLRLRIDDSAKTPLGAVSALASLELAGSTFLIAASAQASGVTSFRVEPDGTLQETDVISAQLGMPVAGTSALALAEVAGTQFVLAGSTNSSTITALRMNELGVFFIEDQVMNDLTTRFQGLVDLDSFSVGERSFVVAGGADDGLSLFELGPTGQLFHVQSVANQPGQGLQGIQSVSATRIGDEVQIFAGGQGEGGLVQLSIDAGRIGELIIGGPGDDTLQGGARDDHLEAGGGDNVLRGGAGDDRLVAGPGENRLFGGAGADVFVFRPGGGRDWIMDFELGVDRIDLSAYGFLHSPAGLDITSTDDGARILVQGDEIRIRTEDRAPLTAADFAQDDFLFL